MTPDADMKQYYGRVHEFVQRAKEFETALNELSEEKDRVLTQQKKMMEEQHLNAMNGNINCVMVFSPSLKKSLPVNF